MAIEKGTIRLFIYTLVYVFYLCMGSLIFATLEAPVEQAELDKLKELRAQFLDENRCVNDAELEKYVLRVIKATKHGIEPIRNVTTFPNWNFASAFLYSGTLVTTIGYGDIAPLSDKGKIFTIVFALFGIPMTAILLTAIVERMLGSAEALEGFMSRHYFTQPNLPKSFIRAVNVSLIVIVIVTLIILLPALFFTLVEKWGYFESLYFCFITLTTIGLGDYTPGDSEVWLGSKYRNLYKILCVLYFLVGLSFVVLILEMCAKVPEDHPGMLFSCHKPMLDDAEDDTELKPLRGAREHENTNESRDSQGYHLINEEDKDKPYPSP
ncbi:potassium channel subfamily K member 1-like [Dendronephthya gigantea]|uniref:potassium channel subfamily K member 1-like n=1 Tax=Dendronephthya gigantea TaxID=151771 RepID=UPI0010691CDB|nr:potassium channel subfamily K member 1-like [Dendronephthya gigantea]